MKEIPRFRLSWDKVPDLIISNRNVLHFVLRLGREFWSEVIAGHHAPGERVINNAEPPFTLRNLCGARSGRESQYRR